MRRLLAVSTCTAVLACSRAASPPPPDPTSDAGFCDAAVPRWCRWLDACNPAKADEPAGECVRSNLTACRSDFGVLAGEVSAGRLRWDPERARRCLDALSTPRCGGVLWDSCQRLVLPAVPPGGSCVNVGLRTDLASFAYLDECLGSADHHACPIGVCGGTCPAPSPIGGSCGASGQFCESDAYCAPSPAPARCQPRKVLGEPCGLDSECRAELWCRAPDGTTCAYPDFGCACAADLAPGDACVSSFQCPAPLECLDHVCRSGTGAAGQSCGPLQWDPAACEAGLACIRSPTAPPTCGRPRAEGEPCLAGDECADGLLCRSEGRCGRPSPEGGPCAARTAANWGAYEGDCAAGFSCVLSSCVRTPSTPGASCDPPTTYCYGAGVMCNPGLLRCEAVGIEPGASCAASGMCAWSPRGLYCAAGVCQDVGGPGAPCTAGRECFSMTCGPDGRCLGPCGW